SGIPSPAPDAYCAMSMRVRVARRADDVWVRLPVGHPESPGRIEHNVNISRSIRGFFQVPYAAEDPGEEPR
ncbi:MAG: hypothetical protein ACXWB2_16435, partial [Acidimicrobiales bacterium]